MAFLLIRGVLDVLQPSSEPFALVGDSSCAESLVSINAQAHTTTVSARTFILCLSSRCLLLFLKLNDL